MRERTMSGRWTKTDVRTLRSQLDGFVLENRMYHPMERICSAVASRRSEIVVGGLRGFRGLFEERAAKNEQAWRHFESHLAVYGSSTPEMIERFKGLADKDAKAAAKTGKLIARVEAEGLPAEVVGYAPDGCGEVAR